jgi:cyclin B
MTTRGRALSHVENQGEAAMLAAKRVVAPMRAALGNININTRQGSQSEQTSKDILKPANLVPRPLKEKSVPAPKKTENEATEQMDMSAVAEDMEVVDLHGVINIDAEDVGNPQLVTDYVNEIYSYLRIMEKNQDVKADYLAGQTEILPKMRAVLVDWMVGVHLQFHMLQETLFSTVAILDRYLQKEIASVSRKKLQLVGVACMLIAAKYEEIYAPEIKDFVYITDHAYSEREIQKMEVQVLHVLKFDLGRPLPLHFLRRASKAGGVDSATHTLAKYICELGLGVYSLAHIAPSKLSAAALALAMRLVEPSASFSSLWSPALVHYTKYTAEELGAVITPLAEVLFLAPSAKLGTVYTKFCNKKFMKISRIPLLDDPILRKIAKGEVVKSELL